MRSTNKAHTSPISNKEDLNYDNIFQYMICVDTLILNYIPKTEGAIFNYASLQQDYKQDEFGGYNIGDSYILYRSGINKSNYFYSFNIHRKGEHVGMLHLNSRTQNKRLIKLEIENEVFYSHGIGWYEHQEKLAGLLGLKINNISQLHIALDAVGMYMWFLEKHFRSTRIKILPTPDFKPIMKGKIYHLETEFIIGSMKSGKVNALYEKSPEIIFKDKPYITNAHLSEGLPIEQGIDRFETRLGNKWLSKFKIKLEDLNTQEGLERIFAIATEDVGFWNLKAPKVRDCNNNYKYAPLYLFNSHMFKIKPLERVKRVNDTSVHRSERAIAMSFKSLFDEYIRVGRKEKVCILRFYMSCEENFIDKNSKNHSFDLMDRKSISMDRYKVLVKRYCKSFIRDKKKLTDDMLNRIKSVEEELFSPDKTALCTICEEKMVKLLTVASASHSPYAYFPITNQ